MQPWDMSPGPAVGGGHPEDPVASLPPAVRSAPCRLPSFSFLPPLPPPPVAAPPLAPPGPPRLSRSGCDLARSPGDLGGASSLWGKGRPPWASGFLVCTKEPMFRGAGASPPGRG